jgi:hypothetical protein
MSYMDMLPASEPTTANERIRSMLAKGLRFTEYETRPNGDVLGAVHSGRPQGHWMDVVVPADGGKVRVLG